MDWHGDHQFDEFSANRVRGVQSADFLIPKRIKAQTYLASISQKHLQLVRLNRRRRPDSITDQNCRTVFLSIHFLAARIESTTPPQAHRRARANQATAVCPLRTQDYWPRIPNQLFFREQWIRSDLVRQKEIKIDEKGNADQRIATGRMPDCHTRG